MRPESYQIEDKNRVQKLRKKPKKAKFHCYVKEDITKKSTALSLTKGTRGCARDVRIICRGQIKPPSKIIKADFGKKLKKKI